MGKFHPSRRSYATSISNTQTNLEQLGGNSKAGLGFNIGLQNSLNQHIKQRAPTLSGSNMIIPKQKGFVNSVYEINTSNQLNNIRTVKYGMTRSPDDGVNKIEREFGQKYTDYWLAAQHLNRNIPIIRGILPTNCCLPLSFSEKQLEDVLNKKIVDNFNFNLGNDLDNNLGNELPNSFLSYFNLAVDFDLTFWNNSSQKFLIEPDTDINQVTNGIFVRSIVDQETTPYVPASFVSNRSPVPNKVYILTDMNGPVVLLMKISNTSNTRKLLPSKDSKAKYIVGYPHDANSIDSLAVNDNPGRRWWRADNGDDDSGRFGQGLHENFPQDGNPYWFEASNTPGAWGHVQTEVGDKKFKLTVIATEEPEYNTDKKWTTAKQGGGGIIESKINIDLFPDNNTNNVKEDLDLVDGMKVYETFINKTFYGQKGNVTQNIITSAYTQANQITTQIGENLLTKFNQLLDGNLPGCLAYNTSYNDNDLDMRLMLSKVLAFNTQLWKSSSDYFNDNEKRKYYWGWNEIPVYNDNSLWLVDKNITNLKRYNLMIYIPYWHEILTANKPWDINGSIIIKQFWDSVCNQLEQYIGILNDADEVNFIFATDEYVKNQPTSLAKVLDHNTTAWKIAGFTSLGNDESGKGISPPKNFKLVVPTQKKNYVFEYIPEGKEDPYISDSFVWKND